MFRFTFLRLAAGIAVVTSFASFTPRPVHAQLSAPQKQQLSDLLSIPSPQFITSFTVTRRFGFQFEGDDQKIDARARLALPAPAPTASPLSRARYALRRGIDLRVVEDEDKAIASFAIAGRICREAQAKASGSEKARLLALEADVREMQGRFAESMRLALEAARVAPQSWEPHEQLGSYYGREASQAFTQASGKTGSEATDALNRAESVCQQAMNEFQSAVSLMEKAQPVLRKRDPQPYFSQINGLLYLPYWVEWAKAQREANTNGKPFQTPSTDYVALLRRLDTRHTVQSAALIQPRNPYAIGFETLTQAAQAPAYPLVFDTALLTRARTGLKAISAAPEQSLRMRAAAVRVAGALYTTSNKFMEAADVLKDGLMVAPRDEQIQIGYAIMLLRQTPSRAPDAEAFLRKQIVHSSTQAPRLLLARLFESNGKLPQAEDVLDAALAESPNDVSAQIATAVIRLEQNVGGDHEALRPTGLLLQSIGRNNPNLTGVPWVSFVEATVVYYALDGQIEYAKSTAEALLRRDTTNKVGKTLLSFLSGASPVRYSNSL